MVGISPSTVNIHSGMRTSADVKYLPMVHLKPVYDKTKQIDAHDLEHIYKYRPSR